MKECIDCNKDTGSYARKRCLDCIVIKRRETQKENKLKYQYHKTAKHRYATYKRGALSRGYGFELSFEDFILLWNKSCTYCGETLEGIGLDRRDNSKGYTLDNVYVCCTTCNMMKGKMSHDSFLNKCDQISKCFTGEQSRLTL